jgi:hypothetical protein
MDSGTWSKRKSTLAECRAVRSTGTRTPEGFAKGEKAESTFAVDQFKNSPNQLKNKKNDPNPMGFACVFWFLCLVFL